MVASKEEKQEKLITPRMYEFMSVKFIVYLTRI